MQAPAASAEALMQLQQDHLTEKRRVDYSRRKKDVQTCLSILNNIYSSVVFFNVVAFLRRRGLRATSAPLKSVLSRDSAALPQSKCQSY